MSFVIVLNVGIKRIHCMSTQAGFSEYIGQTRWKTCFAINKRDGYKINRITLNTQLAFFINL